MEVVDAGYKMTEVGIIPNDWILQNLGKTSVLKARIGWQGLTTAEYQNTGDYVLITGTDFDNGYIRWESCVFVSEERYKQDKNIQISVGDVLVTKDGTIGKVAYIDKVPLPTTLNSGVFVIRPHNHHYDSKFFYHILMSIFFKDFLSKLSAGSTINHLYQKDFIYFNFPLPPTLTEQKAIATALSDVDALISSLDKLIEKKKAIKVGAMQELLTGKTRLAGFGEGVGYKDTEVGRVPGDWELKVLGSCLVEKPKYGIGAAAVEYNLNLPTYLRITDIDESGRLVEEDLKSVDNIEASNYYLDDGDIVLARTGASVGKSYFYHSEDRKLVFAGFLIRIKSNPNVLFPSYLNAYLKTSIYWRWINVMSMRSGQPGINSAEYSTLPIPLPSNLIEQKAIAEILGDMDSEIKDLKSKKDKYNLIKQGMMQELLTGKTRLTYVSNK